MEAIAMVDNPKEVNIKVIGYDKDIVAEESSGNYRVDFHLSSEPPGSEWIDAFEDAYSASSSFLQGNAKIEGKRIIVKEVNESIDPQILLDAVVNKAVQWANIEYNKQISTSQQKRERAKQQ
jgi:hypothetical protein